MNVKKVVHTLNVPRIVCNHIYGKEHTLQHRLIAGVLLVAFGAALTKFHVDLQAVTVAIETLAALAQGAGTTPLVEMLIKSFEG